MSRVGKFSTPPNLRSRAGANMPFVPISLNTHTRPRPQGWMSPLCPCSLLAAGGQGRGGPPPMENRVLIKLCSAASHVILLWALHPTHSTSLVQEDPIGGYWRPSSPSGTTAKHHPCSMARGAQLKPLDKGASRYRPGFWGPFLPNENHTPTLPWRRQPGRSA